MSERHIGVIINGATGRMGTTQHMANLLAIARVDDSAGAWSMTQALKMRPSDPS